MRTKNPGRFLIWSRLNHRENMPSPALTNERKRGRFLFEIQPSFRFKPWLGILIKADRRFPLFDFLRSKRVRSTLVDARAICAKCRRNMYIGSTYFYVVRELIQTSETKSASMAEYIRENASFRELIQTLQTKSCRCESVVWRTATVERSTGRRLIAIILPRCPIWYASGEGLRRVAGAKSLPVALHRRSNNEVVASRDNGSCLLCSDPAPIGDIVRDYERIILIAGSGSWRNESMMARSKRGEGRGRENR